jgi:glucose dehydrogenase
VRQLPEPKRAWPHQWDHRGKLDFDVSYSPVVAGQRIFVPSNVTDSVTAYRIDDGAELWRFYTDGPVRLAPAVWNGSVYFVSDDGHLYCVSAETGALAWKFRGGPSDHRLLGNERIINLWAARGGPVVKDGTIYFAAGIWPLHGVFIYALDAESGDVKWVNDTTSSDYVELPHGGADATAGSRRRAISRPTRINWWFPPEEARTPCIWTGTRARSSDRTTAVAKGGAAMPSTRSMAAAWGCGATRCWRIG